MNMMAGIVWDGVIRLDFQVFSTELLLPSCLAPGEPNCLATRYLGVSGSMLCPGWECNALLEVIAGAAK